MDSIFLYTTTILDIFSNEAQKKNNITSTVEQSSGEVKNIKKYSYQDSQEEDSPLEKAAKIRVFDVSDIDWESAEEDIFLLLNWNDLKIGEYNTMEEIVYSLINMSSQMQAMEWLNRLFLKHIKDVLFLCSLFHTLSHMEYEEVVPQGPTMAMAALNHEDDRVIGYAIKAFSNWNSKSTLTLMKAVVPRIPWAKKEWDRVVNYIEMHGDEEYELFNEDDKPYERVDTRTA